MQRTVKETLKSVIVLFTITLVCVGLLSVANAYLKYEATLDADMAKHLYEVCPTGESSSEKAIEYFELTAADDKIAAVNAAHKKSNASVVAVYRSIKGANSGRYIVQAQAHGNDSDVVMLTSYDDNGRIMKTNCYSQTESYWSKVDASWFDNVVGLSGELDSTDFATSTGATNSLTAVARAVTVSNYMAAELLKEVDAELAASLNKVLPAGEGSTLTEAYERVLWLCAEIDGVNASAPDDDTGILGVYKATTGEYSGKYIVLAQSKNGQWYPPLQMLTAYDENGKIIKTVCHYCEDSYYSLVSEGWYDNVSGKSGTIVSSDFATDTGATNTLSTMAKAVTLSNELAARLTGGNA